MRTGFDSNRRTSGVGRSAFFAQRFGDANEGANEHFSFPPVLAVESVRKQHSQGLLNALVHDGVTTAYDEACYASTSITVEL
ncbi:MAG: hypothetical protein U1E79_12560 [Ottowia sp.]